VAKNREAETDHRFDVPAVVLRHRRQEGRQHAALAPSPSEDRSRPWNLRSDLAFLEEIEQALERIIIQGHRYSEGSQRMIDR
jgi:hypothetical protein